MGGAMPARACLHSLLSLLRRAALLLAVVPAWSQPAATPSSTAGQSSPLLQIPVTPEPAREVGAPLLRSFAPRAYRGHEQVWCGVESTNGTMVFGNHHRVLEYDGLTWRHIDIPGGSYMRAMARDAAGTIWVAGTNELGRLVPGADGRLRFDSLRALVPSELGDLGAIWCVYALADGVWFQSNIAALRWNGTTFDVWRMDDRKVVLSFPWRDSLLVARDQGWFLTRPGGQWEPIGDTKTGEFLPRGFHTLADGTVLMLSGSQGFKRFDGTTLHPYPTPIDEWLKTKKAYSLKVLADGRLLITSLQGGAVITPPDFSSEVWLDEVAGLPTMSVIRGVEDRFGALWLTTDRGITRVDLASPFTVFNRTMGLGSDGAESLERVNGRITSASGRGSLVLELPEKRPGHAVFVQRSDAVDKFTFYLRLDDGILAGGITGLFWIAQGRIESIKSPSNIREIIPSRRYPGRYYATHLGGLTSWRREGNTWKHEGEWPGIKGEVRGLHENPDGSLWISTPTSGLLLVHPAADPGQPATTRLFADTEGIPVGKERVFMIVVGGTPLFSTAAGIFRFDSATQRFALEPRYQSPQLFPRKTAVRLIAADDRGGLWLLPDPDGQVDARLYYLHDGRLQQVAIPDSQAIGRPKSLNWERCGDAETLWLTTENGVLRCDIGLWRATDTKGRAPANTLIRSLVAGTTTRPLAPDSLVIAARENSVRFSFGTPAFSGEPDVVHESRLIGFSGGEAQLAAGSERAFTNLPAGHYTFEVRGRTADARWSEPARLAFVVLAPWWQTGWAWALYVITAGLLVFVYIRWRIRRLTRERTRLEGIVADRTAELAAKNRELERLNRVEQDEKLAALLAEEKARLELLRYQLNPHFLFNSLNSIRALVFAHPEAAGEMVTKLSEFCRWTLTRGSDETATISDELEMVRTYLEVEKVRWQEGLVTTIQVDDAIRTERLPQFLLLPLIENAIKYGSKTSPGVLEIRVGIHLDGDYLACEVANTGHWVVPATESSPTSTLIGLDNLRQRLARHYGPTCLLEIVRDQGWVRMRLRLKRGLALTPVKRTSRDPFPSS